MKRAALIFLTIALAVPNLIPVDILKTESYDGKEAYDPSLAFLNSVPKLTAYIDAAAQMKEIPQGSIQYAELTETVIKKKFFHGFSHYSLNQNWIAAVAEKLFGIGLGSIVDADEILKHPRAGCSQQSIVMVEVLKNKGFDYRNVSFPHHYAMEFGSGRKWYFFDANMEPDMTINERLQSSWNSNPMNLQKYYDKKRFNDLDWKLGVTPVKYGKANATIAANATLFHSVTGLASKTLWLAPLFLLFYPARRSIRQRLGKILFYSPNEVRDFTMDLR